MENKGNVKDQGREHGLDCHSCGINASHTRAMVNRNNRRKIKGEITLYCK